MKTTIQKLSSESTVDKIFYNMFFENTSSSSLNLEIDDFLDRFIIPGNPRDWSVSIVRFSIPLFDVPIMFYSPDDSLTMTIKLPNGRIFSSQSVVPFLQLNSDPTNSKIYLLSQFIIMLNM
jgi:hypothetical protein